MKKEEAIKLLRDFTINYSGTGEYIKEQSPNASDRIKMGGTIRLLLGN